MIILPASAINYDGYERPVSALWIAFGCKRAMQFMEGIKDKPGEEVTCEKPW